MRTRVKRSIDKVEIRNSDYNVNALNLRMFKTYLVVCTIKLYTYVVSK